jgi:hypothetical protein
LPIKKGQKPPLKKKQVSVLAPESLPKWLAPLVAARRMKHSPELRQTRVLLPERFTVSTVCSFGATYILVVSPLIIIRIYKILQIGHTKKNSQDFM